jgi:threonine dehydrogenase-like Zn-dependent dehydrogenase
MADTNRVWHLTGTGYESLKLAEIPVPKPGPREVLLRQECVTVCFSAIKEIKLGSDHPRLAGRDLASDPVILGDESVGTVMEVGSELQDRFRPGEVYVIQPDLGDGRAFGYGIPGGLVRYRTVPEEFCGQLLRVEQDAVERYGFFSFPLAEPLGCVEKSCSIGFRPSPRRGGRMLLVSSFSAGSVGWGFDGDEGVPNGAIVVDPADAFQDVTEILLSRGASVRTSDEAKEGDIFDDIIVAAGDDRELPELLENVRRFLDEGGTLCVIGGAVEGRELSVDIGAVHYRGHIVLGGSGPDISSCYRARRGYGPLGGDTVLLLGAGGPMGQMFVLWLLGNEGASPERIVCTDVDKGRLEALRRLGAGAPAGLRFDVVDALRRSPSDFLSEGEVDYLVILCPVLDAVKGCVPFLTEGAVINCFAGMKGAELALDAGTVMSRRLRIVGFSGLDTPAMRSALSRIVEGKVDVSPVVAAVGGFATGGEALEACGAGRHPGKIVVYSGVDAPLRSLADITDGASWSADFERRFLSGEM